MISDNTANYPDLVNQVAPPMKHLSAGMNTKVFDGSLFPGQVWISCCMNEATTNPRFPQWSQSRWMIPVHVAYLHQDGLFTGANYNIHSSRSRAEHEHNYCLDHPSMVAHSLRDLSRSSNTASLRRGNFIPGVEAGSLSYPDPPF
jgi:hypothetical protein